MHRQKLASEDDPRKDIFFQNKWSEVKLSEPQPDDIQWKEIVAIFVFLKSLRTQLQPKKIHIYTDNEAVKYFLNVRFKLNKPDL